MTSLIRLNKKKKSLDDQMTHQAVCARVATTNTPLMKIHLTFLSVIRALLDSRIPEPSVESDTGRVRDTTMACRIACENRLCDWLNTQEYDTDILRTRRKK